MSHLKLVSLFAWTLAVALTSGCVGTTTHSTASGRPEVTISGKVAKSALGEITNEMINISYVPKARSETVAVFDKELDRSEAFVLGGIGENKPVRRVTYDIVESDSSTRILASYSIVTDPGGKKEKLTTHNDTNESIQWQEVLNRVKVKLNR